MALNCEFDLICWENEERLNYAFFGYCIRKNQPFSKKKLKTADFFCGKWIRFCRFASSKI